jgi:isoleucyl-tRNA synthetase
MNDGKPPYKMVLTHGFVVDKDGRKMSKSLGNVIAPQTVTNTLGADILRLWVASTDYKSEVSLSDEILQRTSESYRRIRNTVRYLLGNLQSFEADQVLPYDELLDLDQWAMRLTAKMQADIEKAYADFQFHTIYQRIHQFCVVDMGGFYLDILKDRLYTCQTSSHARLSAQTAMHHILESLVRCLMPIVSFTAEEIWEHMPGEREDSVLFSNYYNGFTGLSSDEESDAFWQQVIEVRDAVSKQIEAVRGEGKIGASLDAKVTLYAKEDLQQSLAKLGSELRFVLITSGAEVLNFTEASSAVVETSMPNLKLSVTAVADEKCVRCWHRCDDVGAHQQHPELCGRCIENVDGDGESRLHA